MTRSEQLAVIGVLIDKYAEVGKEIKEKVASFNSEFNEKYPITENDFFNIFAPLYGEDPEEFTRFKNCFDLLEN